MTKWREWGLTPDEWDDCQAAAVELAELAGDRRSPSAEEIAAQLAVAKAAELPLEDPGVPSRRLRVT
jgi:hypothetical protein